MGYKPSIDRDVTDIDLPSIFYININIPKLILIILNNQLIF